MFRTFMFISFVQVSEVG